MSEQESNVCAICGGMLRIDYTIEFRECMPHSISVEPNQVVVPGMRLCPGHPEPAPKHDGKLDEDGSATVWYDNIYSHVRGVLIDDSRGVCAYLEPKQSLSLLAWLEQERGELQRLAEEAGQR
jgi:hypothetical protein